MSAKIILEVTAGDLKGKKFEFDEPDQFVFGRMDDCRVRLPSDEYVSRHHFVLEASPPQAGIRDLGSRNGTYINGTKYGGREADETPEEGRRRQYPNVNLRDGDEIQVGNTVIAVHIEGIPRDSEESAGMYCQRCGKDISGEGHPSMPGDYICASCQNELQADPLSVLMALGEEVTLKDQRDRVIKDHIVERRLGIGGMGAVYLVKHRRTGERAALKVMRARVKVEEKMRGKFLREVKINSSLCHQNIVAFREFGSLSSSFYFLLEYCQGGDVEELMRRHGGRLPLGEAAPIMLQSLAGMAHAHECSIVHRDLKPSNILLAQVGGGRIAKIGDMGLAVNFQRSGLSGLTTTGDIAGTPVFMPKEQVVSFRDLKPVSDVWSLGATFYYMLTGLYPRDFPPDRDPIEVILNDHSVPIRSRNPHIPKQLATVIDRALAYHPEDRYRDAGEMYRALEEVL